MLAFLVIPAARTALVADALELTDAEVLVGILTGEQPGARSPIVGRGCG
jgi:hypothetical protein